MKILITSDWYSPAVNGVVTSVKNLRRELEERGTPQPFEEVLRDIEDRDFRDTHREAAPLRRAEDAALLDTSALDFRQSLEALLEIIRERTGL